MKKNNSLSKHIEPLSMDRKATIKKISDNMNFSVFENESRLFKIQISPHSTVGQLISSVKQRLTQNSKDYIGLTSRDSNEIIDYTLKMRNFPLSNYSNNTSFQIQRKGEVQNDNQPSLGDFQFLKLLGSGISASVYLVRHKGNGSLYAMKQISKGYFKDFKKMEQVLRQRKIMIEMLTGIAFTTRLMASFQSQKYLNFVLEYYPGGQMFIHLQRRRLCEDQAKLYVAQMMIAIEKLHQKKIIYRDLKPQNIMIDFQGHARLGDYGLCKMNLQYYDLTYTYCGSQQYMAPEVRSQSGYNYSVDFYTLGSFAYQLVNGVPPYYNNEPLFFQETSTCQFAQVITSLIEGNMHKRLKSFNQIRRLKWFKNIEWKKVLDKKYQMPFKLNVNHNYIGQEFKHQVVDPDIVDEANFDKLLECFSYLSTDSLGISQFYGRNKIFEKRHVECYAKNKRVTCQNAKQKTRKNQNSKNSHHSSKSTSKQKNIFGKKVAPIKNIYTSQSLVQKSSKNIFSSNNTSKSNKKKSSSQNKSGYNKSQNKGLKKSQKIQQKPQKIVMKKIISSSNLMSPKNTYRKVLQLQKLFSPKKMTSPIKMRSGQTNL